MRRMWTLICLLASAWMFPSTGTAEPEWTHSDRVIRAAFDRALPPFSSVDEFGEASGFAVDLIRAMAEQRGWKVEYVPLDWDEAQERLRNGSVDVILGMTYSAERDQEFDFSDPFFTMSDVLLVPHSDSTIHNLNDLQEKVVAVQRGSTGINLLQSVRRVKTIVTFSQPDALQMLLIGRADAFIGNRWTAEWTLARLGRTQDVMVRAGMMNTADYAFAVREGNYRLLQELNQGLIALRGSGTFAKLYSHYFEPFSPHVALWWKRVVAGLVAVLTVIGIGLAASFWWNKRLKQEVRRHTRALADNLAFQRQVLDRVDAAILSFDHSGVITLANEVAGRMFGIDPEAQALGRTITELLPQVPATDVLSGGEPLWGEFAEALPPALYPGGTRYFAYYAAPLYNATGERVGGIVCVQDRTEQKHLQARLVSQEKMRALGQLVAGIAHELRNPLTAIKTFVELMPRKMDDPLFRSELLRHVPEEIGRMNRIVEDLLDTSRVQPLTLRPEPLLEPVESVLALFRRRLAHDRVEAVVDVPSDLRVLADRGRLKQVLINLIANALDAMSGCPEKRLSITARPDGEWVSLTVADTGDGITREAASHLFEPFFTTKQQGIGLGLYLCDKIMREHGGTIEVSNGVDRGAAFVLRFRKEGEHAEAVDRG